MFLISGVLPGTYTISLADGDRRCWQEVVKKISVSEDVKNINFKQTGYNVQVYISSLQLIFYWDLRAVYIKFLFGFRFNLFGRPSSYYPTKMETRLKRSFLARVKTRFVWKASGLFDSPPKAARSSKLTLSASRTPLPSTPTSRLFLNRQSIKSLEESRQRIQLPTLSLSQLQNSEKLK